MKSYNFWICLLSIWAFTAGFLVGRHGERHRWEKSMEGQTLSKTPPVAEYRIVYPNSEPNEEILFFPKLATTPTVTKLTPVFKNDGMTSEIIWREMISGHRAPP
jgi:hypothetical protein